MSSALIEAKIEGHLPTLNVDFRAMMGEIADMMNSEIADEFLTSGHSRWPAKKTGEPSRLIGKTEALYRSRRVAHDDYSATVFWGEGLPYPKIHQFGGTIKHPGSSKFQSWISEGARVYAYGTKAHTIRMPKRDIRLTKEFIEKMKTFIGHRIIGGFQITYPGQSP